MGEHSSGSSQENQKNGGMEGAVSSEKQHNGGGKRCSVTSFQPKDGSGPYLRIRDKKGEKRFASLKEGSFFLGRSEDAAIQLDDKKVSNLHAMVVVERQQVQVVDLGSTNGIKVNGKKIRTAVVNGGDRIRIGNFFITLFVPGSAPPVEGRPGGQVMPFWLYDMPCWAVSALLHGIVLVLVGAYVVTEAKKDDKAEIITMKQRYKAPPYEPMRKRAMERSPEVLNNKKERVIKRLKPQEITIDIPKGTSFENMSNKDLDYKGPVDVFGAGGGAAGAYGHRFGKHGLVREGGGEGTEKAVLAALLWLKRHQSPDGRWSSHDFTKQCKKGRCRNKGGKHGDGRGIKHHDVGMTALALMAFTGAGHTHQYSRRPGFEETVRDGMHYLKRVQNTRKGDPERGRFGSVDDHYWIYDQALATMALGELLVLTGDLLELARPVQYAAELCLKAQNKGYGWRYGIKAGDNDTSITGWMVLALKTCRACGLSDPSPREYSQAFHGALNWLRKVSDAESGKTGYRSAAENRPHSTFCMSAVGVLCRIFAGERRSSRFIQKGAAYILKNVPQWKDKKVRGAWKINFYYWYYGSYALFQNGGKPWEVWNKAMKKALLRSQRRGGCEDGSWDPIGQWCDRGGRVYATALGAMTLEVYYRFVRARGREL